MTITVVFDPPLPTDSPETFNSKAFTLLGDLNDWSSQANEIATDVNNIEPSVAVVVANIDDIVTAAENVDALADKVSKTGDTVPGQLTFTASNLFEAGQRFFLSHESGLASLVAGDEGKAALRIVNDRPDGFPVGGAFIILERDGDANHSFALGIDTDNQLAIGGFSLGAVRRRVYLESNVVGTVSQSGGIPTGAIIEKGSNANGEWVKFADGTLYQTGVYPTSASDRAITFPQAFSSVRSVWANHPTAPSGGTQAVVVNCHSANSTGMTVSPRTISGGTVAIASGAGTWNAYGRWFV